MTSSRWKPACSGQCMACHNTVYGYRSMKHLLGERNREAIGNLLTVLHEHKADSPYRSFMPALAGTKEEITALGDYLATLNAGNIAKAKDKPAPAKVAQR